MLFWDSVTNRSLSNTDVFIPHSLTVLQTPELWSSEGHDDDSSARICFKHRLTTSSGKDRFRGPPHFVGSRDEFVACVTSGMCVLWMGSA